LHHLRCRHVLLSGFKFVRRVVPRGYLPQRPVPRLPRRNLRRGDGFVELCVHRQLRRRHVLARIVDLVCELPRWHLRCDHGLSGVHQLRRWPVLPCCDDLVHELPRWYVRRDHWRKLFFELRKLRRGHLLVEFSFHYLQRVRRGCIFDCGWSHRFEHLHFVRCGLLLEWCSACLHELPCRHVLGSRVERVHRLPYRLVFAYF
jgi:hypothetical protein